MARSKHFFATPSDLLPGLECFEGATGVRYFLAGLFASAQPEVFTSAKSLPGFGIARFGDALQEPAYLVLAQSSDLVIRDVVQRMGGCKYAIDQLHNPDSLVFRPGGVHNDRVLISGEISNTGATLKARNLYQLMVREVTRGFEGIRCFWVGREAQVLLAQGARLTGSVSSPTEYDLVRRGGASVHSTSTKNSGTCGRVIPHRWPPSP